MCKNLHAPLKPLLLFGRIDNYNSRNFCSTRCITLGMSTRTFRDSHTWELLYQRIDADGNGQVTEKEMAHFLERSGADPAMTTSILQEFVEVNPRTEREGFSMEEFKDFMDHLQHKDEHPFYIFMNPKFVGVILGFIGSFTLAIFSIIEQKHLVDVLGRIFVSCGLFSVTWSEYARINSHWRDIHKLLIILDVAITLAATKPSSNPTRCYRAFDVA